MSFTLGFDTSNYTTSCALFDVENKTAFSCKQLLPVKEGERGLRQSDAVFFHTRQMPLLIKKLFHDHCEKNIEAVGYSNVPRNVSGSYMPCFLVGENSAICVSETMNIDAFKTSHQVGHVLAALYSCGRLDLLRKDDPFLAFHISGGTTDMLLCRADSEKVIDIKEIGTSLDLKAGQAVDRIGVRLGLSFPCGPQFEKLALKSNATYKIKPTIKGLNCCLSGLENKCINMINTGVTSFDVAKFCLDYIYETICGMTNAAINVYGNLPVVFAGGVMSNSIIKKRLSENTFDCYFSEPEFSCDNAVGVAVYAAVMKGLI